MRGSWGEFVLVFKLQHKEAEHQRDGSLADELGFFVQAKVPGLGEFDVVVGESQPAQREGESQNQNAGDGEPPFAVDGAHDVGGHVGDNNTREDGNATHGRGSAFTQVGAGPVFPNFLSEPFGAESPDEKRCQKDRDKEADRAANDDLGHSLLLSCMRPSATRHKESEYDAFTNTASPGASSA